MTKSLFFLFVLVVLSLIFSQLFFYQLDGYETATLTGRAVAANHQLAEFLFVAGLVGLFVSGRVFSRFTGYLIFVLFILIYSFQYASVFITGDYLSPTAIDNVQHIGLVLSPIKITIVGLLGIFLLVIVFTAERICKTSTRKQAALLAIGCFAVAALFKLDSFWLNEEMLSARSSLYHSEVNYANYLSPLPIFKQSLGRVWQTVQKSRPLTKIELQELQGFGITYDEQNAYPLIKDYIYQSELPFTRQSGTAGADTRLNVIVFLSEGLAARVMQPYNNQYPDLTPNIADFANSAMRVDNYYNHTFATYRGLLGQLCSIFPVYAGGQISTDTEYYCLGDLFNEEGYETYFLFSQQKEKTKLHEVLAKTNISHIFAQEDLQSLYLGGESEKRPLALSDQQFMRATIAQLRALEDRQKSGDETPFFLGLYNIETHAYYHASDDGVTYKQNDSYILDAIHNYDDAFGKFWEYFQESGLFTNTIVIFTTDHTHFQGKDFLGLVNNQTDYKPLFVDKIPLLIYHPRMKLPKEFDANFASSIDLAPTIAHLMSIRNRSNSFLGRSIFDRVTNEGLAYGEGHIYLIGQDGIEVQNEYFVKPGSDTKINRMYKVINNFHALETQGRIWDRDIDK